MSFYSAFHCWLFNKWSTEVIMALFTYNTNQTVRLKTSRT